MSEKLRRPSFPGEILREEYMKPLNITNAVLAASTGIPVGSVGSLLRGKGRVTYGVALRLAKYLNTTPEFWLNLQQAVDQHVVEVDAFEMRQINNIVPVTGPVVHKAHESGLGAPPGRRQRG